MHERFHESDCMATIPVTTPLLRRSSTDTAPTELPLLDWIKTEHARVTPVRRSSDGERMPDRAPGPGEQYRFHVDMGACIGCKCCVVACNEQNGNPAPINWRRVGEIEGGWFPSTSRSYLSMGCNHCLEPTCLEGCPVDAYTKDPITGIVLPQRRCLHRLSVLHLELFVRCAAVQPRARCRRQVRHVLRPPLARSGACVCQRLP